MKPPSALPSPLFSRRCGTALRPPLSSPQEELRNLDEKLLERCHFFNSFFYKRLWHAFKDRPRKRDLWDDENEEAVRRGCGEHATAPRLPFIIRV